MPGTMNMFSAIQKFLAFDVLDPNYMDLAQGYSYCIVVHNTTGTDIDSGTMVFEGADAKPDNVCEPDTWSGLDPVAGCASIVSGVPEIGPVSMTFSPQRPIKAHSVCLFAVPCPKQFFKVTSAPGGCTVIGIISNLRRTDWSHFGPLGQIPQPLAQPFQTFMAHQAPAQLASPAPAQTPAHAQPQPPQTTPPGQPRRARQAAE